MDASLFHVLHDGGDERVAPVAERVDVDLDGSFEEPVDQDAAPTCAAAATDSSS